MANETIYGCVNFTTGQIEFTQDSCTYNACMEWTGAHAGQVKLTNPGSCNDTYYGCVNWATGKFQVVIPDNCCDWEGECDCTKTNDCPDCYAANQTPQYLAVRFSGVRNCDDDSLFNWNDIVFCVPYGDWGGFDCGWNKVSGGYGITIAYYSDDAGESGLTVSPGDPTAAPSYFGGAVEESCQIGVYNNVYNQGDCGGNVLGYGGTGEARSPC